MPTSTAHYVETTGDAAILDEQVPFLDGPALRAGEHDRLLPARPGPTRRHRCSSIARAASTAASPTGAHGLPLMGTGDWNDGMNRVGEGGKGESVWLGWFLHAALARFMPDRRGARRDGAGRRLDERMPAR